ncbi:hypothetical protein CL614_02150 [archaeon]|nr:hypothetical protein [archaeon]|tara:strand:+ start:375 stop:617 length:243 start_codon:yes stop_codon:yes gene_type:complete
MVIVEDGVYYCDSCNKALTEGDVLIDTEHRLAFCDGSEPPVNGDPAPVDVNHAFAYSCDHNGIMIHGKRIHASELPKYFG